MKQLRAWRVALIAAWFSLVLLPAGCGTKEEGAGARDGSDPKTLADPLAEAKERSKANLKQIATAFNNYHDAHGSYPVGLIDPKTARIGLSWRVQILPHLKDPAAADLYKKFNLNEPWDSEHNKKLLAEMPRVYAPVRGQAPAGYTFYQGFADHLLDLKGAEYPEGARVPNSSASAFFPDPRYWFGLMGNTDPRVATPAPFRRVASVQDGTTNTILVTEAGEAVPWTKPQDIPFRGDMTKLVLAGTWPKLGGLFDGDFHVAMVDGTIYSIKKDVPADKLRTFITVAGGEIPDYPGIGLPEPQWQKDLKKKQAGRDGGGPGKTTDKPPTPKDR
jgi:hypothetical protein